MSEECQQTAVGYLVRHGKGRKRRRRGSEEKNKLLVNSPRSAETSVWGETRGQS